MGSNPATSARQRSGGVGRGSAVDMHRTIAVRKLAEKCQHRLFLSATPRNGHPKSLTALLEIIES